MRSAEREARWRPGRESNGDASRLILLRFRLRRFDRYPERYPTTRLAIGLNGKSNSRTTRRDPQFGHFSRPTSIGTEKAAPLGRTSLSRSSPMLALHSLKRFIVSRRPQPQRAVMFTLAARPSARVLMGITHLASSPPKNTEIAC